MELEELADGIVDAVMGRVNAEVLRLRQELGVLRAQIDAVPEGRAGKDGNHGRDGASVTIEQVSPVVAEAVSRAVAALPAPRDGRDGLNGKDGASVTLEAVQALVHAEVLRAVAEIPRPVDGKDGQDGRDGPPPDLDEIARRAAALIPKPRDGVDGRDGKDGVGKDGERGPEGPMPTVDLAEVVEAVRADAELMALIKGERGTDGKDGLNGRDAEPVTVEQIEAATRRHFSAWIVEFERIATDRQQRAIESIPIPRDGRDGLEGERGAGLEDFELTGATPDDGRTLVVELSAAGRTRKFSIRTACVLDQGVYSATAAYQKGDGITFGGQFWIAQRDKPQTKPGESSDWRLAVRRGKDGKDATE